jgi:hypothetical protein
MATDAEILELANGVTVAITSTRAARLALRQAHSASSAHQETVEQRQLEVEQAELALKNAREALNAGISSNA